MSAQVISPEDANKRWDRLFSSVQNEFHDHAIFNTFREFIAPPPRLNCFTRIAENFILIAGFLGSILSKSDYEPSYAVNLDPWVSLCKILLSKAQEIEHDIPGFTAPEEADSPPPYHGYYGSHSLGAALWFSPINISKTLESNYRILQSILFIAVNEAKMQAAEEELNLDSQISKACLAVRKLSGLDYYHILYSLPAGSCSLSEYRECIDEQIVGECRDKQIVESKSTLYSLRYLIEIAFGEAKVTTRDKSKPKRMIAEIYSLEEGDDGNSSTTCRKSAYLTDTEEIETERIRAQLTNIEFTEPREVMYCEAEGKDPSGGLSFAQQYLKAKGAQKSIAMDNQRLPFAKGILAPHDVDLFLDRLDVLSDDSGDVGGIDSKELAAFLAISFWTSRSVGDVVNTTLTPEYDKTRANIAIYGVKKDELYFMLKAKEPELKTEREIEITYALPVPVRAAKVIYPWLERIWEETEEIKIFHHDSEKYEAASDGLFTNLRDKEDSRLNSSRVQQHLHHLVSRLPGSDTTMAMAISGRDDIVGKVHFHYTGNRLSAVKSTYRCAVDEICGPLGKSVDESGPAPTEDDPFVGSGFVPEREEIAEIVKKMRTKIAECRRESVVSSDKLIEFHNVYTSYTVLLTGFCTGYRAVHDPLLLNAEIDRASGFAVISDKDGNDFYNSRIVWLPPVCLLQLKRYSEYLEHLGPELFWRNQQLFFSSREEEIPGRRSERACPGLFYIDQNIDRVDVRPRNLEKYLLEIDFPFPVNSNRHYLRTNLLIKKCPLEVVNAFMGHWEMGLEPWGMFSGLSPDTYRRELSKLEDLVHEDGWRDEIGF